MNEWQLEGLEESVAQVMRENPPWIWDYEIEELIKQKKSDDTRISPPSASDIGTSEVPGYSRPSRGQE